PQDDDVLEVGQVAHGPVVAGPAVRVAQHPDVGRVEETLDRQQYARAALAEDVGRLLALEPGVERYDHAADRLEPDEPGDPLVDVGRPDGHPVAGLDPEGEERPAGGTTGLGEVPERQAGVAV